MNKLELYDKKNDLQRQLNEMVENAEKESRKLNDDETLQFDNLNEQIKQINKELRDIDITNENKTNRMENFSLIKTIGDVVNNRQINDAATEVIEKGMAEMRKSGLNYGGQILIPVENRATVQATVATNGQENVAEDKLNILEPLRNRMVLNSAGATYMTGLVGDVSIPVYSGSNVGWKGEIAAAADGAGNFSEINLSPKRLTAYVDISKQFLNQDSNSAEEMLRRDIINALADKLEATILGNAAGSATQPAGIFNGAATYANTGLKWSDILAMEQTLEEANVNGSYTFIVSPAVKAALKSTAISGGKSDLRMIMEDGEVDGIKVLTTNNCTDIVLGNFEEYVIAQWGAIDLTVDPYTQAANGCIRLVVNAYFDAKPRRATAFVPKVKAN